MSDEDNIDMGDLKVGTDIHIIRESQNSIEIGPAGKRHKIYYNDFEDGKQKIKEAVDLEREYEKAVKDIPFEVEENR